MKTNYLRNISSLIVLITLVMYITVVHAFNPVVHQAQTQLAEKGYYSDTLDGIYGPNTRDAIQNYQKSVALTITGELNDETLESLDISISTDLVNNVEDWRDLPTQDEIDTLIKVINDSTNTYSNYEPNAPAGGLDLPGQSILDAMKRSADTYKSGLPGQPNYSKQGHGNLKSCLKTTVSKGPTHWSDITLHYYCQMSFPRMCYTNAFDKKDPDNIPINSRVDAYQGCIDGTLVYSDKFNWVTNDQALIFQYVMFGQTNAFKHDQEQAIINAFYGVNDPSDKNECNEKRPLRTEDPTDGTHCLVNKVMTRKLVGRSY